MFHFSKKLKRENYLNLEAIIAGFNSQISFISEEKKSISLCNNYNNEKKKLENSNSEKASTMN